MTQLSKDLPEVTDLDILAGLDEVVADVTPPIQEDVMPEAAQPAETPAVEPTEEPKEEPVADAAEAGKEGVKEDVAEAAEIKEELKETVEEAKEAIDSDNMDSAGALMDELYGQILEYSAKIDSLSTKNSVLASKLEELSGSNAELEVQVAQRSGMSNDPKLLILNRMYDNALTGEELSKGKVITALEDMYYSLKGETFDETRVGKESDKNADKVMLNEGTTPTLPEPPKEEEVDINNITSIF